MRRRLRFSEDERVPEPLPKKRKRKQKPPEYYTGESEGASNVAPSDDVSPQSAPSNNDTSGGTAPDDTTTSRATSGEAVSGNKSSGSKASAGETTSVVTHNSRKIGKLEQKSERYKVRSDKAQKALPTKKKLARKRIYDEQKSKANSKFTFESEVVPIHEAKWNKKKPLPSRIVGSATRMPLRKAVTKAHGIVHSVEDENVGVKAAHRGELLGESAYRGGKRIVQRAYRFHRNRPYRKASKLEVKSLRTEAKLSYQRALRDAPVNKNAISRFFQKRRLKRQYAAAFRNTKKSGKAAKKSVSIVGRAGRFLTGIVRRNPIALGKLALLGLIIVMLMGVLTMCMSMLSGGSIMVGAVTYAADYEDIDDAEIAYGEWTVDLLIYLQNIRQNHPGHDEYRFDTDDVGHDPFELMAFLTAVYGDFTFAEVEPTLRALFAGQYQLTLTPEMEIRTRTETRIDAEGNPYTVTVEYEWHVLNITLRSTPLSMLIFQRMDTEQWQHFNILMMSLGARQLVGNPFDRNWLPHVSSRYGYRIHPISGGKAFHAGIDIALPTGTEILSGFDGTVTSVGYDADGWGNFVVIDNGAGIQTLYAHCHAVLVSTGQSVSYGDVIATVGNTGASTGPHLHLEVIRHGRRLNPLFFVVTGFEGVGGGGQILTGNENMVPLDMVTWPLAGNYPITSPFGWRIHPISGQRRHHNGIDLGAPGGTPILAMADGVVTIANATDSWGGGWGFFVRIRHEGGFETLYAHASRVIVRPGQRVSQGEVIAFVGTTGSSTGNHLHFEVIRNGTPIDPMQFFRPN